MGCYRHTNAIIVKLIFASFDFIMKVLKRKIVNVPKYRYLY